MDRKCPNCAKQTLEVRSKNSFLRIDDKKQLVSGLEHSICSNCGRDYVFSDQAKRNDLKIADARRSARGLLTSKEIIAARKQHGLNQSCLSRLLGGGANSIHKYESGTVTQSVPMDTLIRIIRDVPGALTYVAQHRNIPHVTENHPSGVPNELARVYSTSQQVQYVVSRGAWKKRIVPSPTAPSAYEFVEERLSDCDDYFETKEISLTLR